MATKATNQVTLIDLTDAYSVILTSEAHTFLGDTDSVSGTQSTTTQVMALCGSEQVPCSVGTITTPTGISAVSDGKTPSPTITITATSALTSGGVVDIPITVGDDITITKKFSFAIAFTGATGETGGKGNDGRGIKSTTITYAASTSGTDIPSSGWQPTIPTVAAGQYLWTKQVIEYTSGDPTTSYSVGMMGQTGGKGEQGDKGNDGRGIKSTTVTYQASSSGTATPTGTWSKTVPKVEPGQYLWTKTVTEYTSGDPTTSYSVGMMGQTGAKGDQGDKGDDAITLVITSSGGIIFKNTDIATTLTAHVYQGATEVTGAALTKLGTIKWYKDNGKTAVATGQTLTISAGDVDNKATYTAQLEEA